jgi:hypothetical protein
MAPPEAPREDLDALAALLRVVRELAELLDRFLAMVRALLDAWIDRLDGGRGAEIEVQDIPIE